MQSHINQSALVGTGEAVPAEWLEGKAQSVCFRCRRWEHASIPHELATLNSTSLGPLEYDSCQGPRAKVMARMQVSAVAIITFANKLSKSKNVETVAQTC